MIASEATSNTCPVVTFHRTVLLLPTESCTIVVCSMKPTAITIGLKSHSDTHVRHISSEIPRIARERRSSAPATRSAHAKRTLPEHIIVECIAVRERSTIYIYAVARMGDILLLAKMDDNHLAAYYVTCHRI